MSRNRNIVITSGEPAGIGPDICLDIDTAKIAAQQNANIYVIADPALMESRATELGKPIALKTHTDLEQLEDNFDSSRLNIIPLSLYTPCLTGTLDAGNARYVLDMLDLAITLCRTGKADAMVTGPIQKNIICESGVDFTGHTEYLAQNATDSPADDQQLQPVMMLATRKLRVALATTHLPLKDVSAAITTETLITKLAILDRFLRYNAGIRSPKILVCGLNPHAGENGALGDEEINIITPALNTLRDNGLDLVGPLPADTLFTPQYLDDADAVFAMYHDQGLPVLKYSGFGKAVNITLGLPFIRTSVDHGTALGLAGSGQANSSSLFEAIDMAIGLTATAA